MDIKINCEGSRSVPLGSLKPFQGNLKILTDSSYVKLRGLIQTMGFSFPIFVWQDTENNQTYILDGHQRVRTLQKMASEGFTIPDLPVADVSADNFKDAKKKLMAAASQFGDVDKQGLYEFMNDNKWEMGFLEENFKLPEIDLDNFRADFFDDPQSDGTDDDSSYSNKVETPVYEPKGDKPAVTDLYEQSKTNDLVDEIEKSELPSDIKSFLKFAAMRHTVFNYEKIAEFYAHASADLQDLMEKSALVIIDFDKSIEYGFNQMTNELAEINKSEQEI